MEKKAIHTIIAPPYYWGISQSTEMFPRTFTIRPETFTTIMFDIAGCLKTWGFSKVYLVNLHGDRIHRKTLAKTADRIRNSLNISIYALESIPHDDSKRPKLEQASNKYKPDYHAGANETKVMFD